MSDQKKAGEVLAMLGAVSSFARLDPLSLLTIAETATRMGLGRDRVQELIGDGSLRTVMVGGDRRVPAICILEFYLAHAA